MWPPFMLTQQSWIDSLLLRKNALDSTSQLGWEAHGTCLSFSPNTTIEAVCLSQTSIDEQATRLTGPISPACNQCVQYLLTRPTHRYFTNIGRGYNLIGAGLPQTTPRPSQLTVSTFHLRVPPGLHLPPGDVNPGPVPSRWGLLEDSTYRAVGTACPSCD
jgi:hypothetical protein